MKITREFLSNFCDRQCSSETFVFIEEIERYLTLEEKVGMDLEDYIAIQTNGFYGQCVDHDHEKPYLYYFDPKDFVIRDGKIITFVEDTDQVYKTYDVKDKGKTWVLSNKDYVYTKDPYPEFVNIDLSGYFMDDYQSSVEFDDWLARWFEAEYGRVPKNYDYDEEELTEQFITISNIKW